MPNNICPVCGYPHLSEPAYDVQKCALFEICPSCGTEFGNDDWQVTFRELRRKWIESGMGWWSKSGPPPGWDPSKQLRNAGMLD